MHILLTNDDGIFAEGLFVLYNALTKIAQVTVVAPESERSAISHAITLNHPIRHRVIARKGHIHGHAITGTPADCVKFGISVVLKKKPDLVIAGINLGDNDGCSAFYSGTVAAAREGALMEVPSFAISLATYHNPIFAPAAAIALKLAKQVYKKKLPLKTFLNVNVPALPAAKIKGVKFTKQGEDPIHGDFEKRQDPSARTYYWMSGKPPVVKRDSAYDTFALRQGYITVTPIHCDLTDRSFLNELKTWKL